MQDYPNFELWFCVDDEDDQALPVVRDLMAKYPNINAHVAIRMSHCTGSLYIWPSYTYQETA